MCSSDLFLSFKGIHVGTNISHPVPGKLPHHGESRPPKGADKQRGGTKE